MQASCIRASERGSQPGSAELPAWLNQLGSTACMLLPLPLSTGPPGGPLLPVAGRGRKSVCHHHTHRAPLCSAPVPPNYFLPTLLSFHFSFAPCTGACGAGGVPRLSCGSRPPARPLRHPRCATACPLLSAPTRSFSHCAAGCGPTHVAYMSADAVSSRQDETRQGHASNRGSRGWWRPPPRLAGRKPRGERSEAEKGV